MTGSEIQQFLRDQFPQSLALGSRIDRAEAMGATLSLECGEDRLRPGGTVSGPTLMALADQTMYVAVLATVGPVALAVTTNLTINFLRRSPPGILTARAVILKLGKRLCVGHITIARQDDGAVVAHATATYSIPPAKSP